MPRMYTCAFILSLSLSLLFHHGSPSPLRRVACVYIHVSLQSSRLLCALSFSSSSRIVDATIMQSILFFFSFRLEPPLVSGLGRRWLRVTLEPLSPLLPFSPLVCIVSTVYASNAVFRRRTSAFSSRREFFFFFFFFFSAVRANRDNIEETWQGNRCYTLLVRPLCRVDIFFLFNLR